MLNFTYRDKPAQIPVLLRACARSAFYAPSINHKAASRVTTIKHFREAPRLSAGLGKSRWHWLKADLPKH